MGGSACRGQALLARCEQDGSRLTDLRPIGAGRWLLSVAVPTQLQESYGTAPEVLVLAVEGEVQPGDLGQAREELQRHEFDLDLLVVVDDRPHLHQRLDRMFQVEGQWVPWIRQHGTFPPLADTFRKYLPTQDVFERTDAVRGRQVIGRSEVIADLSRRLLGAQAVGIFGLRKMGKTTVVRAVTDRLDPISARLSLLSIERRTVNDPPAMLVAWLDAGRAHERNLDAVAGGLQRALQRRLAAETILSPDDLPSPSLAGLDRLLEYALRTTSVIGRDPNFFEQPEMGGHTNPMLGWFVTRWLGPMPPADADTLLSRFGSRVALEIGIKTRKLARTWSGGHPTRYPDSADLLCDLSYYDDAKLEHTLSDREVWHRPAARTLRDFGLLLPMPNAPRIPQALAWYLRTIETRERAHA